MYSVVSPSDGRHGLLVPDDGLPVDDPEEVDEVDDAGHDGHHAEDAGGHVLVALQADVRVLGVVPSEAGHA